MGLGWGLAIIDIFLGQFLKFAARITFDVLDNLRDYETAKDCVRNIYTNVAVVAALILTVFLAFLVQEKREDAFDGDEDEVPYLACIRMVFCIYGSSITVRATVESVINLTYTESLSNHEIIWYLIDSPGSIGGVILASSSAVFSLMMFLFFWILEYWGLPIAIAFLQLTIWLLLHLSYLWYTKSQFTTDRNDPRSAGWAWAETDDVEPLYPLWNEKMKKAIRKRMKEMNLSEKGIQKVDQSMVQM